jgi:hypothetical protein
VGKDISKEEKTKSFSAGNAIPVRQDKEKMEGE